MTYVPKHRGEPVTKYRVRYIERERGWAPDEWHVDYDTHAEASRNVRETNTRPDGPVPDVYITAYYVGEVVL